MGSAQGRIFTINEGTNSHAGFNNTHANYFNTSHIVLEELGTP